MDNPVFILLFCLDMMAIFLLLVFSFEYFVTLDYLNHKSHEQRYPSYYKELRQRNKNAKRLTVVFTIATIALSFIAIFLSNTL